MTLKSSVLNIHGTLGNSNISIDLAFSYLLNSEGIEFEVANGPDKTFLLRGF